MQSASGIGCKVYVTPIQQEIENQKIINKALPEALNRLKLKFPGRTIVDHEVQFKEIQAKNFANGALECKHARLATSSFVEGYLIYFTYDNEIYDLRTVNGGRFLSDELYFEPYTKEMLDHALGALSKDVNENVTVENIILDSVEEGYCTALTYEECGSDYDKYCNQQVEKIFSFKLKHNGNEYEYCFNAKGEARHMTE